jgi:putative exporter of polyketide antibiotics
MAVAPVLVLLAIAVAATTTGMTAFQRRDVVGS